jgi:hypothetical protein
MEFAKAAIVGTMHNVTSSRRHNWLVLNTCISLHSHRCRPPVHPTQQQVLSLKRIESQMSPTHLLLLPLLFIL